MPHADTAGTDTPLAPVIIVHGYSCPRDFMRPLQWRLERQGYRTYLSNLLPLCVQDVRALAERLARTVEDVLQRETATKCQMVGISQGGIVALTYMQELGGNAHVARLISVGTPWLGSPVAQWAAPLAVFSPALKQLVPGNPFLAELRDSGVPEGSSLHSLSQTGDWVSPPAQCAFPGVECVELPADRVSLGHQGLVVSPTVFAAVHERLVRPLSA